MQVLWDQSIFPLWVVLLEVFFGDGCGFFSHVDDIQFHFTKFSLEDRTIMLFANCVLTRVWSQDLSLSYILLVSTYSICLWNLRYLNYSVL